MSGQKARDVIACLIDLSWYLKKRSSFRLLRFFYSVRICTVNFSQEGESEKCTYRYIKILFLTPEGYGMEKCKIIAENLVFIYKISYHNL